MSGSYQILSTSKQGFTIVEALITMSIVAILTALSIAAWGPFMAKKRARTATEDLHAILRFARNESMIRQSTLTISFRNDTKQADRWCYGLSDTGDCDCRVSDNCVIDGKEFVRFNDNTASASLSITDLAGNVDNKHISFEGIRGTTTDPGTIEVNDHDYTANLSISPMGFVHICSNQISGYPAC